GGEAIGGRGPDGRLQVLRTGGDTFSIKEWLAADGDARGDPRAVAAVVKAREGFACDEVGCVARVAGGGLVAIAASPAALADDCARAVLVVAPRTAPPDCAAVVIDRKARPDAGALSLRRVDSGGEMTAARPATRDRPWAPAPFAAGAANNRMTAPAQQAPRDATPPPQDLGADD